MIAIYTSGMDLKFTAHLFFHKDKAMEYLETLRPANQRPANLILYGFKDHEVEYIREYVLFLPQIYILDSDFMLSGLWKFYVKYISRIYQFINYENGEK